MNQDSKRCGRCGSFRAYYTMGYCSLLRENNGYCMRHNKVMEKSNQCDQWHCRRLATGRRVQMAIRSLPEIYKKIAVIEEILTETTDSK